MAVPPTDTMLKMMKIMRSRTADASLHSPFPVVKVGLKRWGNSFLPSPLFPSPPPFTLFILHLFHLLTGLRLAPKFRSEKVAYFHVDRQQRVVGVGGRIPQSLSDAELVWCSAVALGLGGNADER